MPGRRCVRVAAGGEVLAEVRADRGYFSCVLGGEDGHTLFIEANRYGEAGASDGVVLTQRVDVPGQLPSDRGDALATVRAPVDSRA